MAARPSRGVPVTSSTQRAILRAMYHGWQLSKGYSFYWSAAGYTNWPKPFKPNGRSVAALERNRLIASRAVSPETAFFAPCTVYDLTDLGRKVVAP